METVQLLLWSLTAEGLCTLLFLFFIRMDNCSGFQEMKSQDSIYSILVPLAGQLSMVFMYTLDYGYITMIHSWTKIGKLCHFLFSFFLFFY